MIRPDINVVTLEDPVEYQMGGVNQVQINERVGLTFAGGLRTILRQDPDIVMVGEIRDPETASIAMQASMTGHLVLSTLHTNDAPAAVSRLIDMGVEPFLITSSLTLVVGQRLARVPCSKCSEPVEADPKTLELLGLDPDQVDEAGLRSGPGCGFCAQTGYQGRLGLFEVVKVTRKVRELIVARATEVALKEEAVAGGMRSMRADGLAKALAGRTTLEEVLRVTPPDPDLARRASRRAGAQSPPPAQAQVPQPPKTPPKVLVLDDDSTIAEIAAAVLVDGYEIVAASHLDEGLRMVEFSTPSTSPPERLTDRGHVVRVRAQIPIPARRLLGCRPRRLWGEASWRIRRRLLLHYRFRQAVFRLRVETEMIASPSVPTRPAHPRSAYEGIGVQVPRGWSRANASSVEYFAGGSVSWR